MNKIFIFAIIFICVSIIINILSTIFPTGNIFERFSSRIGNIIQILLVIGLFLSYKTYISNTQNTALSQQASLTEKGWVQVYDKIQSNYNRCPNFCNSLTYPWQKPPGVELKTGKDEYGCVLSISILIFQSLSNVLAYFMFVESGDTMNEWISSFITWAHSDTLYEMWNKNKFIYDELTVRFGDYIFKEVRKNKPKNNEDVIDLSINICNSEEVKDIFLEIGKVPQCKKKSKNILNNLNNI
jgi:hypothetical protein